MSIIIIGGNEKMISKYKDVCKMHNCKAKVFVDPIRNLRKMIGSPDLIVLFTGTVSHKMVEIAVQEAEKSNISVLRSHSSSGNALSSLLEGYLN